MASLVFFMAMTEKLIFNGHCFSQMLYSQGLVGVLPFLSPPLIHRFILRVPCASSFLNGSHALVYMAGNFKSFESF